MKREATMSGEHDKILDLALAALTKAPVDGGEIYYQNTHETSASVVDQRIESVEANSAPGVSDSRSPPMPPPRESARRWSGR